MSVTSVVFMAAALGGALQGGQAAPSMDQAGLVWTAPPSRFELESKSPPSLPVLDPWSPEVPMVCTAKASGRVACAYAGEGRNALYEPARRVMTSTRVQTTDGASPEGRKFAFTVRFGQPRRLTQLTATSIQ